MKKTLREYLVEGGAKDEDFKLDNNRHYSVIRIEGNLIPRMKTRICPNGGGMCYPGTLILTAHLNDQKYCC
ncbi:hypothetical protein HYT26_02440 [Candidatus Pacearchaeota archaeon]|nr:hypothetical protein [Candidatus Pacearchaeota archaeon]